MDRKSYDPYFMTDEKEAILWENAILVFDSSSLLNMYHLPKLAREKLYLEIFNKYKKRLWIPHHVQYEYLKNRENVIIKTIKEKYGPIRDKIGIFKDSANTELWDKIDEISKDTLKDDNHPYLEQTIINELKKKTEEYKSEVKSLIEKIEGQIDSAEEEIRNVKKNDDVLGALEKSFTVGREFSFDEFIEITKEGEHRYKYKIPPGYGDLNKKDKKGTQIFGDLIIWKQILEFSKEKKLPIIFIIDDNQKDEDWYSLDKSTQKNKNKSPRAELIKEVKDHSGVDFWMYNLPRFLELTKTYLESTINKEEIQVLSQNLNTKNKKGNHLKFSCNRCKKIHKFHESCFILDYELLDNLEECTGAENLYLAKELFKCDCGNKIEILFEACEYPIDEENFCNIEIFGAELLESFKLHTDLYYDDGFYPCHECKGNKDNFGNFVDFEDKCSLDNEYDISSPYHAYNTVKSGNCQWCDTQHIKCPKCKSVTSMREDDKNIECEGGCDLIFLKETDNDYKSVENYSLKLIDHRKTKCRECGELFIDNKHIEACDGCESKRNDD